MAETVKKTAKAAKPDEKAAKDAVQALTKTDAQKAAAVKALSDVQVIPEITKELAKAAPESKSEVTTEAKAEPAKASAPKPDASKGDVKAETKKETDPSKEFVDGIMTEMSLKGASKKRLIRNLSEQYGMDKQKVLFRLKRALITERYAALHEAGH